MPGAASLPFLRSPEGSGCSARLQGLEGGAPVLGAPPLSFLQLPPHPRSALWVTQRLCKLLYKLSWLKHLTGSCAQLFLMDTDVPIPSLPASVLSSHWAVHLGGGQDGALGYMDSPTAALPEVWARGQGKAPGRQGTQPVEELSWKMVRQESGVLVPSPGLSASFCKMGHGPTARWLTGGLRGWAEPGRGQATQSSPLPTPSHRTTYLLAKQTQRHDPVRERHDQHHEVGQQPGVRPELGPPNQVALQEGQGVSGRAGGPADTSPTASPSLPAHTGEAGAARAGPLWRPVWPPRDTGSKKLSFPPSLLVTSDSQ